MAPPASCGTRVSDNDFQVTESTVITAPEGAVPIDCPVLPLTPLEHVGLPFVVTTVLSFPTTLSADRVKRAVEHLLATFPVLAGRILRLADGLAGSVSKLPLGIVCNNAGAIFRRMQCRRRYYDLGDPDLSRLAAGSAPEPPYVGRSDVEALMHGQEPLLQVCLVHFVDQGSLLSVGTTQGVVDGFNFGRTVRALMANYRGEAPRPPGGQARASGSRALAGSAEGGSGSWDLGSWDADADAVAGPLERRSTAKVAGGSTDRKATAAAMSRSKSAPAGCLWACGPCEGDGDGPPSPRRSVLHAWWEGASPPGNRAPAVRRAAAGGLRRLRLLGARVSKHCLRIPPGDVRRLRDASMDGCKRFVSDTDAISGLVWLLATSVRRLPTFVPNEDRFMNVSVRIDQHGHASPRCCPAPSYHGNATAWIGVRPLRPRVRDANHVPPDALRLRARMAALDDRELNGALGWASYSVRRGRLEFRSGAPVIVPKMVSSLGGVGHFRTASYRAYMASAFYACDVHVVHVGGVASGRGLSCGESSPLGSSFGGGDLPPWTALVTRDEGGGAEVLLACSRGEWESIRGHSILARTLPNCEFF